MNNRLVELTSRIDAQFGERLKRATANAHEITYDVAAADLLEVCSALRDAPELKFEMLMDVCGIDYLHYGRDEWRTFESTGTGFSRGVARGGEPKEAPIDRSEKFDPVSKELPQDAAAPRFAAIYHLLSLTHNWRVRLRCSCPDATQPILDSVVDIWSSANWFEREAFDLYGILFRGHPDLRRLLTDYGFIGYPFRKDFPLIGNVEVRYDETKGRVIYQPVSIDARVLVPEVIREDHRYEPALKDKEVRP